MGARQPRQELKLPERQGAGLLLAMRLVATAIPQIEHEIRALLGDGINLHF